MLGVQTNIPSLTAQASLGRATLALETVMQQLSTGHRINSAKDDAAGLQITNRMSAEIGGLLVASRNANDGISVAQTAEGAMSTSTIIFWQMRNLAIQSANDSNGAVDRAALQQEVAQLVAEIDRIAATTSFGGQKLLDGSYRDKNFQVGVRAYQTIPLSISSMSADGFGTARAGATFDGLSLLGADPLVEQTLTFTKTKGGVSTKAEVKIGTDVSAKQIAEDVHSGMSSISGTAANKMNITLAGNLADTKTLTITINGITHKETASGGATNADGIAKNITDKINKAPDTGIEATLDATNKIITITNTTGENFTVGASGDDSAVTTVTVQGFADETGTAGQAVPLFDGNNASSGKTGSCPRLHQFCYRGVSRRRRDLQGGVGRSDGLSRCWIG